MRARFRLTGSSSKLSSRAGSRAIQGFVRSRGVPGYSTRSGQTTSRPPGKMASVTSRLRNRAHRGSWFGQRGAPNISHIPVYYLESVTGTGRALGFDAASDPTRRDALDRARDTGQPTATDPLTLIQDIEREGGFVVFLPVYKPGRPQHSLQDRRFNLQGYVSGAFRIRDVMNTVLTGIYPLFVSPLAKGAKVEDIEIRLYDASGGEKKRLLYEHRSKERESQGLPVEANEG